MIDDLFDDIPDNIRTSQFADDGALWTSSNNINKATKTIQISLNNICKWTEDWGFQLSTRKNVAIVLKKSHTKYKNVKLCINNQQIPQEKQTKFLGVTFDQNFNWNEHINNLLANCNRDLNIIRILSNTRWGSNKEMLLILYKSLIKSNLLYGSEAWSDTSATNKNKLKTIQSKAFRYITGALNGTPTDLLHLLP